MRKIRVLGLLLFFSIQAIAFNYYENMYENSTTLENQILSKDIIIKKYRYYKGKRQYRRWNDTKKRWVDPKWINIP